LVQKTQDEDKQNIKKHNTTCVGHHYAQTITEPAMSINVHYNEIPFYAMIFLIYKVQILNINRKPCIIVIRYPECV